MPKHYSSLPQHNANLICAVDLETTGSSPRDHEIIQAAFVPLDTNYEVHKGIRPFYMNLRPLKPETAQPAAMRVNGLDLDDLVMHGVHPDRAADKLVKWYEDLDLAFDRRLIMLAHNASFEMKFLEAWLGNDYMQTLFNFCTRDSMSAALTMNDMAVQQGKPPPFEQVNLTYLARYFNINNPRPHDACADATTGALVYREIMKMDVIL